MNTKATITLAITFFILITISCAHYLNTGTDNIDHQKIEYDSEMSKRALKVAEYEAGLAQLEKQVKNINPNKKDTPKYEGLERKVSVVEEQGSKIIVPLENLEQGIKGIASEKDKTYDKLCEFESKNYALLASYHEETKEELSNIKKILQEQPHAEILDRVSKIDSDVTTLSMAVFSLNKPTPNNKITDLSILDEINSINYFFFLTFFFSFATIILWVKLNFLWKSQFTP